MSETQDSDGGPSTVKMTMLFTQSVTVEMPMEHVPPTPEDALDAWWNMGPDEGIDALWGNNKRFWTCRDVEVADEEATA